VKLGAGKKRTVKKSIAQIEADRTVATKALTSSHLTKEEKQAAESAFFAPSFSKDAPLVFAHRGAEGTRAVALSHFYQHLADIGKPLRAGSHIRLGAIGEHEAVYHVTPTGMKKLTKRTHGTTVHDLEHIERGLTGKGDKGRYVILPEQVVDPMLDKLAYRSTALGRGYKRVVIQPWKTAATLVNPQYHVSNLVGDLWKSYSQKGGMAGHEILPNLIHASHMLARRHQLTKATRAVAGRPGKVSEMDKTIREAEKHGVIGTGFAGADITDLRHGVEADAGFAKKAVESHPRPIERIRKWSQEREDLVRLSTYLANRKRGLSAEEAAKNVSNVHIDYGDLTVSEQKALKSIFPFYTFTARNVPAQIAALTTRPGKFANLQKVREESQKGVGLKPGWEKKLRGYEKRGLPIPTPLKQGGNNLALYPKLPASDIGRTEPKIGLQAALIAAQLSPTIKVPIELMTNKSLFFGEEIQRSNAPLVPAPTWAGDLPEFLRKKMGIRKIKGPSKSGGRVWGWPAKTDYIAKQLPSTSTALQYGTEGKNRGGRTSNLQALSYLTGAKFSPLDPRKQQIDQLFAEKVKLENELNGLRQEQRKGKLYKKKGMRLTEIKHNLYRLQKRAGYAHPYKAGAPPKGNRKLSPAEEFKQFQKDSQKAAVQSEFEAFKRKKKGSSVADEFQAFQGR
jgi:hypothetical protein